MDALLLLAVVSEVRGCLAGALVEEVHPAGPDGLWLALRAGDRAESLVLTADPALPRISRGPDRPPKLPGPSALVALARRRLPGARLDEVRHAGLDRAVQLRFVAGGGERLALVAELFGRRPALFLLDAAGVILEAVRGTGDAGRRQAIGASYSPPPGSPRPDPAALTVEALAGAIAPGLDAGLAPALALRQSLRGIAPHWAMEIATQAADPSPVALAQSLLRLLQRVASGPWEPCVLLGEDGQPAEAIPLRLAHLPAERQEAAPSLGAALERLARFRGRLGRLQDRQQRLHRVLKRLQDRLRSRRAKLERESEAFSRGDQQQRMGEVLVQHQRTLDRGRAEVTLPDPAGGPGAALTIPMDPALSPLANAERLFKAARRARRGAVRVTARVAETDRDLERVQHLLERLQAAAGREELDAIQAALGESRLLAPHDLAVLSADGAPPRTRPPAKDGGLAPSGLAPRRFASSDGLPILVGRNPEGNDYLTQHLARSNDLWLHVQNRPGSHVVVRAPGGAGIPRRTLVQAAQLAAYYSQARDEGKVAVDYTLKKYVRKPRKAKPGLVTISQEKTIIVSPDKSLIARLSAAPPGRPPG